MNMSCNVICVSPRPFERCLARLAAVNGSIAICVSYFFLLKILFYILHIIVLAKILAEGLLLLTGFLVTLLSVPCDVSFLRLR